MTTKDDGGPAFPLGTKQSDLTADWMGMSLRDYFAGQALAGCGEGWFGKFMGDSDDADKMVAKWAYETADAMLAARQGGAK